MRQATRSAVDPRLRTVTDPVVGKALDAVFKKPEAPRVPKPRTPFAGSAALGDSYAGINSRGDALQSWNWYAILPDINYEGRIVSLPWYYAQSSNIPSRSIQSNSHNVNGHPIHYPESYSVEQLQLGLFMDDSNKTQHWLKAWESTIVGTENPKISGNQGMWGLPAEYKKEINIVVLNSTKEVALNFKYLNCWPATHANPELVSGSGEAMLNTVSFLVEDVHIDVFSTAGLLPEFTDNTSLGNPVSSLSGFSGSAVVNNVLTRFGLGGFSFN